MWIAVVNILPPLYELANNLTANFQSWSEKRKLELRGESTVSTAATTGGQMAARPSVVTSGMSLNTGTNLKPEVVEELKRVDERVAKFRDKITALKLPEADRTKKRRSSFRTNVSG